MCLFIYFYAFATRQCRLNHYAIGLIVRRIYLFFWTNTVTMIPRERLWNFW